MYLITGCYTVEITLNENFKYLLMWNVPFFTVFHNAFMSQTASPSFFIPNSDYQLRIGCLPQILPIWQFVYFTGPYPTTYGLWAYSYQTYDQPPWSRQPSLVVQWVVTRVQGTIKFYINSVYKSQVVQAVAWLESPAWKSSCMLKAAEAKK